MAAGSVMKGDGHHRTQDANVGRHAGIAASLLSLALAGCGGGGGGGSSATTTTPGASSTPTLTSDGIVVPAPVVALGTRFQQGQIGTNATNSYGMATVVLPAISGAPSVSVTSQLLSVSYLDEAVKSAWASGWTGRGQTISVIDDFNTPSVSLTRPKGGAVPVDRVVTTTTVLNAGTYSVSYDQTGSLPHGSMVSNIAGGDAAGSQVTVTSQFRVASVKAKSCGASFCSELPMYWGSLGASSGYFTSAQVTYNKTPGYAREATVVENQVNLSASQSFTTNLAYVAGHLDNSADFASINLSLGTEIPTDALSLKVIQDALAQKAYLSRKSNAVVVIAAGNSGAPCSAGDLAGCNFLAATLALAPQTRESVIVAGALTGSGPDQKIASYSVRAGALAHRFLLADGDGGEDGVLGTSFAAPRIAGAVALVRQRYPNLTAAEAANILLLTANKDINNDGIADFSGVSSIYGHGKLDLSRALAPGNSPAVVNP